MTVLHIDRVDVAEGRLEAVVRVCDEAWLTTRSVPRTAERLTAKVPAHVASFGRMVPGG